MRVDSINDTNPVQNPKEIVYEVVFEPNTEYKFPNGTYFVNRTDATLTVRLKENAGNHWNCTISTGGYRSDETIQLGKRYAIELTGGWIWETETKPLP